jgi:hypothetical protein
MTLNARMSIVDSWPKRRRFLPLRLLRAPVRHLASVHHEPDRFTPRCVCGWRGATHDHQADAFAEAHVHTRYIDTKIVDPTDQLG